MEQSFLAWLRGRQRTLPQVELGIGDDAAVIHWPAESVIATVDTIVDGVDFKLHEHDRASIGRKALAVSLSDIAAMGAEPVAVLVSLQLPKEQPAQLAAALYEGLLELASEYKVALAGGDLTVAAAPLALTTTVLGALPAGQTAWTRRGAQVGDLVCVTGSLGGSILGHHLKFTPRLHAARQLARHCSIHAAIDISDGLSLDLDRLCAASGVGVELDLMQIPIAPAAFELSGGERAEALEHALGDGEDFELLLTMSPESFDIASTLDLGVPLTVIGKCVSRTGLWAKQGGKLHRLNPRGYVHGAGP
jgi:thiamine-monophosphate kinase